MNNDNAEPKGPLPEWLATLGVAHIPADVQLSGSSSGFCVWLTGLPASGKSTTGEALAGMLMQRGRKVVLLDGDVVRASISHGLGFGKEDRDANVRRIGLVAYEVVRRGGAVICAVVSPYQKARNDCRDMIGADKFVEVFVDTPLHVCEQRDPKGLYAKARRGALIALTGIDDPYEAPAQPNIVLDTVNSGVEDNARRILSCLERFGLDR